MKPIRSKRDLALARKALHDLRHQLAAIRKVYHHDKEAFKEASRGLRDLVRETQRAITLFEQAQARELPGVVDACNALTGELEVPRVLRLLRQAQQLSQAQLAEQLGTRQANISRWERDGCESYNLVHLKNIADQLGYDIRLSFQKRDPRKGAHS